MARDIPEPTFIEFGQIAQAPVWVTEDLGWQRVVDFCDLANYPLAPSKPMNGSSRSSILGPRINPGTISPIATLTATSNN